MISEWLYQHKTFLITILILMFGGVGGVFVLAKEETNNKETNVISDAQIEKIEEAENVPEIEEKAEEEEPSKIKVDIKGAVKNPNVYEVVLGSRILDLIHLAGGISENAYTNNINLSKKVTDEMVIYIFTKEEYESKVVCCGTSEYDGEITEEINKKESVIEEPSSKETINMPLNLNTATKEQLESVPNIGSSKAEKIIEYRNQHDGFKSLEELKEISGIGDTLYEKIKTFFVL